MLQPRRAHLCPAPALQYLPDEAITATAAAVRSNSNAVLTAIDNLNAKRTNAADHVKKFAPATDNRLGDLAAAKTVDEARVALMTLVEDDFALLHETTSLGKPLEGELGVGRHSSLRPQCRSRAGFGRSTHVH